MKSIKPEYATIVDPFEYDIDQQMARMVKLANKDRSGFADMDVGKIFGLYLSWKRHVDIIKRAIIKFNEDGTDGQIAAKMLEILEENG